MDRYGRDVKARGEQAPGLLAEVLARNFRVVEMHFETVGVHQFQHVAELRHGQKKRFNVVVTVGALADDVETQVDFRVGKQEHGLDGIWNSGYEVTPNSLTLYL